MFGTCVIQIKQMNNKVELECLRTAHCKSGTFLQKRRLKKSGVAAWKRWQVWGGVWVVRGKGGEERGWEERVGTSDAGRPTHVRDSVE